MGDQCYDKYVIAVHMLFAISLSVIFIEFSEDLFPPTFSFKTILLVTVFATILLSWIGYNNRIEVRGHGSSILFVIDVIIIYFYINMAYSINDNLSQYVLSLIMIFVAYLIWYPIKYFQDRGNKENSDSSSKDDKRQIITIIVSVGILATIYILLSIGIMVDIEPTSEMINGKEEKKYENVQLLHWVVLVILWGILITFRRYDLKLSKKQD